MVKGSDTKFAYNHAASGGAVMVEVGGTLALTSSVFNDNEAVEFQGMMHRNAYRRRIYQALFRKPHLNSCSYRWSC